MDFAANIFSQKPTGSDNSDQPDFPPSASDSWEKVTSEFTVPSSVYKGLEIEQKSHKYIKSQVGEANVSVDESLDETTVCFDIFFADPNDKNLVEVKQPSFFTSKRIDIKLDVTVKLSSASALETLAIGLANQIIIINGNHSPVFSNLLLKTGNGRITINEFVTGSIVVLSTANGGITTRGLRGKSITLSTANGYIDAGIDNLSGKLNGSIANGKIEVNVASISGNSTHKLELSSVNGDVDLSLPDTFESTFQTNAVIGRTVIQSSKYPEKIHYERSRTTSHVGGYYGDKTQQTGNNVKLTSVIGRCSVIFG
ncbi:hypothetical protein INT45_007987 [Circinella minor]|uniref:DUF4097 domain-containing protein n=1 Tax=Circinella minor TaxID=1195481 RepID=A0A8H7S3N0_9FUNG|nr:hypothetical protein INT45_007987 [Circinella minor]